MAYSTVMADKLHSNSGNDLTVTAEELGKALVNQNAGVKTASKDNNQIEVTFTKSGNVYTVDSGTGKITGSNEDQNKIPTIPMEEAKEKEVFEEKTEVKDTDNKDFIVPADFKIASDSADTVAEGVVIEDTTANHNQFVWVPVDDINEFRRIEGYSSNNLQSILNKCTEPFANGYSTEQEEYNAMYDSVKNNKGFYIGRFEAGKDGSGNVVVKKGVDVYNNVPWGNAMNDIEGTSQTGGKVGAVKLAKEFAEKNNYRHVTSTLCYSVQWDATMQFMDSNYLTNKCEESSYVRNSNGRGHYNINVPTTTGSKKEYAEKNIYDMAGNITEWVMEAYNTGNRVFRGGSYGDAGSRYPASFRGQNVPVRTLGVFGFRVTLYL